LAEYVAFLRGINVGGNKTIKMDALREAFESLGFEPRGLLWFPSRESETSAAMGRKPRLASSALA